MLHHILPDVAIASVATSLDTYEQVETASNVLLLLLCRKHGIEFDKHDFAPLEIDFVSYLTNDAHHLDRIFERLPNVDTLYAVAENRNTFYPFGTIKAYTALSILINSQSDLIGQFQLEQVIALAQSASNDREIDDVANATWKFVHSLLASGRVDVLVASESQLWEIMQCLHHLSQTYKSAELRFTAANIISIISRPILKAPQNPKLLINFSELVLILLRDDCVAVRNRISDFVFELVNQCNPEATRRGEYTICSIRSYENGAFFKILLCFISFAAIPIVAEDTYLQWLDQLFVVISPSNSWSLWRELLRNFDLSQELDSTDNSSCDANGISLAAIDDIFDANEANIFGETLYACFKCYGYLLGRIETATNITEEDRSAMRASAAKEFPMLADF